MPQSALWRWCLKLRCLGTAALRLRAIPSSLARGTSRRCPHSGASRATSTAQVCRPAWLVVLAFCSRCAAMTGLQTRAIMSQRHLLCCEACHQAVSLDSFARSAAQQCQFLAHPCLVQRSLGRYAPSAAVAAAGAPQRQAARCTLDACLHVAPSSHSATTNRRREHSPGLHSLAL